MKKLLYKSLMLSVVTAFTLSTAAYANQNPNDTSKMHKPMQNQQTMNRSYQNNSPYGMLDNNKVMEVQQSLKSHGYNLEVDGLWGSETTAAIRSFQRQNDLEATGNLDSRTLSALDVTLRQHNQ